MDQLFQMNAHGDIWQAPTLQDQPEVLELEQLAARGKSAGGADPDVAPGTYRARRLAKAEKLRGWADGREARGRAAVEQGRAMLDVIPFGQPILVGHHSERRDRNYRARAVGAIDRGHADTQKSEQMRARADGIEAAAAGAIYSDDPDALEQLEAKLARLLAEREQVKVHNREMRKPGACDHPADCDCRTRYPRQCSCKRHPVPSYVAQNLTGNITRTRQRLEQLKREAQLRAGETVGEELERDDGGTEILTSTRREIHYPGKPAVEVRDAIKRQGYRWDRVAGCWWRSLSYESQQRRLAADDLDVLTYRNQ